MRFEWQRAGVGAIATAALAGSALPMFYASPALAAGPPNTPPGCTKNNGGYCPPCSPNANHGNHGGNQGEMNNPGAGHRSAAGGQNYFQAGDSVPLASGTGSCASGSTVTFQIVRVADGSTLVGMGTTTAGSDGSFSGAGTIPTNSVSGIYVILASCTASDGSTAYYTLPLTVAGAAGSNSRPALTSHSAGTASNGHASTSNASAPTWTPPASMSAPAVSAVMVPAVDAAAASLVATESPALVKAVAVSHGPSTLANAVRDALAAAILGLAGLSFALLRRRPRHAA